MAADDNFYLGGGKLYRKLSGDVAYVLIGGAKKISYSAKVDYAEVFDSAGAVPALTKRTAKKYDATLKFETDNWSANTLTMFLMATQGTSTLTDTEAGWTAKAVTKLDIGKTLILTGAFKFVSVNASGQPIVFEMLNVSLQASGDLLLQTEDFTTISFEGSVLKDASGNYASMYLAPAV
jgi:hypothetical protein